MNKTQIKIITHRGLNPDQSNFPAESSIQAFEQFLVSGWGLEFDVQFTADNKMIAVHDSSLRRITEGKDERKIREVSAIEIMDLRFPDGSSLATVPNLLEMIVKKQASEALSALHLKWFWQTPKYIDVVLRAIKESGVKPNQLIIFDIKIDTARYIHEKMPELRLSASVSHPYDIKRYNYAVGGTLISLNDLLANRKIFWGAWLDEWDRIDEAGGDKTLYSTETFEVLRSNGFDVNLVTPELHATSPSLSGGEAHQDGIDRGRLLKRFHEIIALRPDGICTDHPALLQGLVGELEV